MIVGEAELLTLMSRCVALGESAARAPRDQARLNEAFIQGRQTGSMVHRSGVTQYRPDDWFDEEELPRVFLNKLISLRMTWVALMNRSRISATAYPAGPAPEDRYRAEVSNRVIRFMSEEEDTASKVQTVVGYGCDHGTSALKVIYDPSEDKVRWSALSIFDFLIDPTPEYTDAKWCTFDHWISLEEAESHWEQAGLSGAPPTTSRDVAGVTRDDQVLARELWHLPCKKYPKGLYLYVVGGRVAEHDDYPYVKVDDSGHPQYTLPIFVFRVRNIRGSAYGGTNITDCIPVQRTVNEMNARLLSVQRKMSGVHVWLPRTAPPDWDPAIDSKLFYEEGHGGERPLFLEPPQPSALVTSQRDYWESQLPGLMALNDRTVGQQTSAVSGVALETTIQLDAEKNADASKSLERMVLNAIKFQLDLVGMFYTAPRKMLITGGDAIDVQSFSGQDTMGVDVRLEVGSELDQRSDVRAGKAEARQQAGLAAPLEVESARDDPAVAYSRRAARMVISQFLEGESVDLSPGDILPAVLDREIMFAMAVAMRDGRQDDWAALHRLQEQAASLTPDTSGVSPAPQGETP